MVQQSRRPTSGRPSQSQGSSPASRVSGDEPYAVPIKKTSPLLFVVGGAVVLGIGLAIAFASGGSDAEETAKQVSSEAPAGLTKEEQKERLEHLRKTQAALEAAELEEKSAEAGKPAPAPAPEAPTAPPANKQAAAPKAPAAPAPKNNEQAKKKAADLDALGADITSQLK